MDEHSQSTQAQESGPKKISFDELSREELINKCQAFLILAQKAKTTKNELLNKIEDYKNQLEKADAENKLSQESVKTLQELVDSLTEQKLNYITELDSTKHKISVINSKLEKYEEKISKYETELKMTHNEIADLTQKLSDIDSENISLKRQNNRLLEENEQLICQLTELESKIDEFNRIGLQQREQLQKLEEKSTSEEEYKTKIDELQSQIKDLDNKLQLVQKSESNELDNKINEYEIKIKDITALYESEKVKNDKANIKLRSYKDKILKCAACINQLKNSRYILSKTVKEYSECIPKWQTDIINASKVLETQVNQLQNENIELLQKNKLLENELKENILRATESLQNELSQAKAELQESTLTNKALSEELSDLNIRYQELNQNKLPKILNDNEHLKKELNKNDEKLKELILEKAKLEEKIKTNEIDNKSQITIENLSLQIKALESEKSMLVKEKLSARDSVVELENGNKVLINKVNEVQSELNSVKTELTRVSQEKIALEQSRKTENGEELNRLKSNLKTIQEQYDLLKKERDDLFDLNGLLKEEVETLKLSLEQPKDDDNASDLNVSLQADIVKLETKLSAYKQENASLLVEVKESRAKVKEFDKLAAEFEEAKAKLASYKTENTELLNEMKEINQVLKERGETISKLQKAVAEMEKLIDTLEKDRDTVKQEKDDLSKKVGTLEDDLKSVTQKKSENSQTIEAILSEKEKAYKLAMEKDALIVSLREEIEKLRHSGPSDLPNEDMSTSTISKAEEHSRMKDLDETFEEKYSKLRIFALKLKKKLNETTTQLENVQKDKAKIEKLLQDQQNAAEIKVQSLASGDQVDGVIIPTCDSKKLSELESKIEALSTLAENTEKELEKIKGELAIKCSELTAEVEAHKVTKDNLEKARRDLKKKNVLSLEMEDYERSLKELTTKMDESKKKIIQMESTIDTQEGTITAMKTQIKLLEEQIKAEESQNKMTKEELQQAIEECKEKDNVIQMKNGIISKLELDLEDERRKNEDTGLEMTSLISAKEKVIMNLSEEKAELNNKLKRQEFKCAELEEKLRIVNIELADLKTEYTSYKVRAQAVLRQNQTVDHSHEEQLKEETAALKAQIETLTSKIANVQEQSSVLSAEVENWRRAAADAQGEVSRAHQRTARLQADLLRISQQLDSERAQHNLQVSTLTQCYKTQINELETKLHEETEKLRKQLSVAQENMKVVKVGSVSSDPNMNQFMVPVIPKDDGSDNEMDINVSMIPREEGEGSESAPSPPLSKSFVAGGTSGRSPVPLERLLEEGVPDDEVLDLASLALTPEQEIAELRRKLQIQQQRVKHVTVLLSESERECARMSQLSELLKAELRRVRGASLQPHNTEYMKNVTLKFLTLPPGDERGRLVPVLQKILTLTPDETQKIQAVAKGMDPNPGKGWGSFLPWPGGK